MKTAVLGATLVSTWLHLAPGVVAAQASLEVGSASSGTADLEGSSSHEGAPALMEPADQARQVFVAGTRLAHGGDWLGALAAYQSAYQLYPHATTLYNIGFCQMKLGDLVAAWQSTAQALAPEAHEPERQMSPERRAVAEQQSQALKERLATIIVSGPPGLWVHVDGRPLLPALVEPAGFVQGANSGGGASMVGGRTPIYVNPGEHTIVLVLDGERQRRAVALAEGSVLTVEWSPASKTSLPLRTPPLATTASARAAPGAGPPPGAGPLPGAQQGAGGATLVGAATVGSMAVAATGFGLALTSGIVAWSTDSHLASVCPTPRSCPATEQGAVERYRHAVKLTNVGLITGLAGSAIGLGLVLFGDDEKKPSTALSATAGGVRLLRTF